MSAKRGRPTSNKKTERLEIRMNPDEAQDLQYCAEKMNITRTEVLMRGVQKIKAELDEK